MIFKKSRMAAKNWIEKKSFLQRMYFPKISAKSRIQQIFGRSFNSEFSFSKTVCLTKIKEFSLPYYLPIAGGRIVYGYGLALWHINHCWLFKAKSALYIYIKYIWFSLVWFYGISTIVGYLMLNPLNTYTLNIYDLVWFGLVWFYGISTIVGYFLPNPVYTYIFDI